MNSLYIIKHASVTNDAPASGLKTQAALSTLKCTNTFRICLRQLESRCICDYYSMCSFQMTAQVISIERQTIVNKSPLLTIRTHTLQTLDLQLVHSHRRPGNGPGLITLSAPLRLTTTNSGTPAAPSHNIGALITLQHLTASSNERF